MIYQFCAGGGGPVEKAKYMQYHIKEVNIFQYTGKDVV